MRTVSDGSWPPPVSLIQAQKAFEQTAVNACACAEAFISQETETFTTRKEEVERTFTGACEMAAQQTVVKDFERWTSLWGAVGNLVDQDRLFRYAARVRAVGPAADSQLSQIIAVVGSGSVAEPLSTLVNQGFEIRLEPTLKALLHNMPSTGVPPVLAAAIIADIGSQEKDMDAEDLAKVAAHNLVILVGDDEAVAALVNQARSVAPKLGIDARFPMHGCRRSVIAEGVQQVLGMKEATLDSVQMVTEFPCKPSVMDVCDYGVLGTLEAPALFGSDSPHPVVAIAPFINQGNLIIEGIWSDNAQGLVQALVEQALMSTGPGQLTVTTIDSELRSPLAVFAALSEATDDLIRPALSDSGRVGVALENAANDIRRVQSTLEGRNVSLAQLRAELNQPVESYQLLVVCDFPRAFTQEAIDLLVGIMRRGPQCGFSVLLHHDPQAMESTLALDTRWSDITGSAHVIHLDPEPTSAWLPSWPLRLARPPANLASRVRLARDWAQEATAPSIDFVDCQPTQELMWDRSDKRLVAAIGRDGHRIVEITLGDEVDQRHNILISGAVGQGKSNLIMVLIHSLAMRYPPNELELHMLDFKEGITLEPLAGGRDASPSWLPHAKSLGLNSDREYGAAVLSHLVKEFDRRADLIRSFGDNISKYRAADSSHVLPRIVLVIDEFQVLFEGDDAITSAALADLERLARKGRAYGIHLVLASQTISGITSLLAKQDGIFAQFPIRLALKNSPSESRAVLQQDNTEAARLRYRGQLLVNLDFGSVEGNRRATVALADEQKLQDLRSRMVSSLGSTRPRPVVFDGTLTTSLSGEVDTLRELRSHQLHESSLALVGRSIDVGTPSFGFEINESPGRHLAVIGSGLVRSNDASRGSDMADGILQSAALSLAVQGSPEFVIVNLLSPQRESAAGMNTFLSLLENFSGKAPVVIESRNARNFFSGLHDTIAERPIGSTSPLFVVAFGLERLVGMDDTDFESDQVHTPADGLRRLITQGPAAGAHLIASWANVRSMRQQLGYQLDGAVDGVAALHVSREEIQDLFGPHFHWSPSDNRGVFYDRVSGQPPRAFVPFRSLTSDEVNVLTKEFARE